MTVTTVLLFVLAAVLVIIGLIGTVLPMLPGVPLVFAGLLLAAWVDGFVNVGVPTLIILAVLTLLSILADFVATALGAKRVGASALSIWLSMLGLVVGIFFGLPGLLLGPFIGAVVGELMSRRTLLQASNAGFATWVGLILGTAAKLALVIAMMGIFLFAWWW